MARVLSDYTVQRMMLEGGKGWRGGRWGGETAKGKGNVASEKETGLQKEKLGPGYRRP